MYKLVFFVPESHKEEVKTSVFEKGAGNLGDYDSCCWEVKGRGQFRPMKGACPFIGQVEQLEYVEEFRVEMICGEDCIREVLAALKAEHPYEEPAYELTRLEDVSRFS